MQVECPHCAEEVEIDPGQGSQFECPYCDSEFEFESNHQIEVDYSEHYWKLALQGVFRKECLDYIERINGELPENRLIEIHSESHSEVGGYVALLISVIGIPVLAVLYFTHLISNSKKEHQSFFWYHPVRFYMDPSEKVIISTTKYKTGWYPTMVSFLNGNLNISKRFHSGEGQGSYYVMALNSKQNMHFSTMKKAEICRENIQALL